MWGFAEDADKNLSTHGSEIPTVPGPMITVNPAPLTVLEAHFNTGADGFAYLDDPFRGTARPKYSRGVWLPSGGFSGGALRVALGGRNYSDILGMSGGWETTFSLSAPAPVTLSFRYNLTQNVAYEADEFSQVLVMVDATLYGVAPNDYVTQISGGGSTGWLLFQLDLGTLPAGDHILTIGGYNNKKTYFNESSVILIDDVVVAAAAPDNGPTPLTIHLRNDLKVPVSIVIPGQTGSLAPVRTAGGRIRSFTRETGPGATGTYTWTDIKPCTGIYHSGTPSQVPMGLYGGIKKDAAPGEAYNGVPYDNEVILFYSEIDPVFNAAVAGGTYGTPDYPSMIKYAARYFLINGRPYPAADFIRNHPILANERVLLRFLNAGLRSYVPTLMGSYMSVIAEDGSPYLHPKEQYSVLLPAGKTTDAIFVPEVTPDPSTYPIYDRRLHLTNGSASPGGLVAYLGGRSTSTLDLRVTSRQNDAEESANGWVKLSSTALELTGNWADQIVGTRFTGVTIPQGATIVNAYLQFNVDRPALAPTVLTIQGQAIDEASAFTSARKDISSRTRTGAIVNWSPEPWLVVGASGPNQQTPDLSSVIQEIVNRPGWVSGNSLAIIITGTGNRVAESFDGSQAGAPLLHVEYISPGPIS